MGSMAGKVLQIDARTLSRAMRYGLSTFFVCLIAVTVYYGLVTNRPLPDYRFLHGLNDLVLHFGSFFALTMIALVLWEPLWNVLCLAVSAAVLLELGQAFLPDREVSALDVAASVSGVLAAGLTFYVGAQLVLTLCGTRRIAAPEVDPEPGS
jgi:VanZ family protein